MEDDEKELEQRKKALEKQREARRRRRILTNAGSRMDKIRGIVKR